MRLSKWWLPPQQLRFALQPVENHWSVMINGIMLMIQLALNFSLLGLSRSDLWGFIECFSFCLEIQDKIHDGKLWTLIASLYSTFNWSNPRVLNRREKWIEQFLVSLMVELEDNLKWDYTAFKQQFPMRDGGVVFHSPLSILIQIVFSP